MINYDEKNSSFWNEPCGTQAANNFGFDLEDFGDLALFDDWYWNFYPYLKKLVDVATYNADSVLEIGVGVGTVSRYLSKKQLDLHLLDVAPETLQYVKRTIDTTNVTYLNQSILNIENINKKYDCVLAIGSLHHTGNLELAIKNAESLLKPNGKILVMVYYAWQPRRVLKHPIRSAKEYFSSFTFIPNPNFIFQEHDENLRKLSDVNSLGEAAPSTAFSSRKLFKKRKSLDYSVCLKNSHRIRIKNITLIPRRLALKLVSPVFGCDIYASGQSF